MKGTTGRPENDIAKRLLGTGEPMRTLRPTERPRAEIERAGAEPARASWEE